uniref:Uncharacterized protein n=1 Tax=Ananas comosus var. bracteatus TaxID=296719 RepID=A0A6V7NNS1_ANACO|nr:unnamed protein product [Ananas comosus var. bracteatus]
MEKGKMQRKRWRRMMLPSLRSPLRAGAVASHVSGRHDRRREAAAAAVGRLEGAHHRPHRPRRDHWRGIRLAVEASEGDGPASAAATYAANLAVIAVCYSGARELARDARASEPGDFMNSVVGGFASGALLGRVQGGQLGAVRYAIIFAAAGTAVDFAAMQISPYLQSFRGSLTGDKSWWKLPEWSPIQVLDEEALAAKRAREQQLYAQRTFGKMNKEDC